ncbi:MAG: rhodanese-like domain-containing protein [Gammaproteobacteria bacterium]|nr:rhodanese-like domain-containing protein [Gammaproteobacteria bacterium]
MKLKLGILLSILVMLLAGCASELKPQPGWYPNTIRYDELSKHAVLPKPDGVTIVDSRPGERKYDKGHIPGAINIPEREFDKMVAKLPKDKASLVIFYCGGVKCMLSHKSAFKAEKLGYSNIKVYAEGYPDWKAKGGLIAVSLSHIKKLLDSKSEMVLIDSRPKKRKYDKGHIPGAISIPDLSFDKMVDRLPADKATPLYFYCGGLKCKLSSDSAAKAIKLGYSHVRIVPEGYPGWKKAYGKGAVFKAPEIKTGKESGTIAVASFEQIFKTAPETLLMVDVRDASEFAKGSFKGAINMPINDLETRMEELPADQTIVFFCGTGGRAGEAYDILQMFKPGLKSYFLNAEITFLSDGSYTIVELK